VSNGGLALHRKIGERLPLQDIRNFWDQPRLRLWDASVSMSRGIRYHCVTCIRAPRRADNGNALKGSTKTALYGCRDLALGPCYTAVVGSLRRTSFKFLQLHGIPNEFLLDLNPNINAV